MRLKTVCVLAILFISLLLALPAFAGESQQEEWQFNKEKLWYTLATPLVFFLHLQIHEATHLAVTYAAGWEVVDFKPYPHTYKGDGYWGRLNYRKKDDPDFYWTSVWKAAPYIVDATMILTTELVFYFELIDPASGVGTILFLSGMVAPFVDLLYNANNVFGKHNDFNGLAESSHFNRYVMLALADSFLIVVSQCLYLRGKQMLGKQDSAVKRTQIVPVVNSDFVGAAAIITF